MALTLISKDELAARGALSMLLEYKQAIAELYKTYPKLAAIEQEERRKATMIQKYGTLTPTKAQIAAVKAREEAKAAAAGTEAPVAAAADKPKVSHKKGMGKKAMAEKAAAEVVVQAVPEAVPEASGDVVEMTPDEATEAVPEPVAG